MPTLINTAAKPEATTSTKGRLRLMLSQDMLTPVITSHLTLSATTNQDHTPMDTMSTRAIQDMPTLINTAAKPEATTSTKGRLRLMLSQDMPTLTNHVTKPEATTSTRGRLRLSQDMATLATVTLPTGPPVMVTVMFLGPLLM